MQTSLCNSHKKEPVRSAASSLFKALPQAAAEAPQVCQVSKAFRELHQPVVDQVQRPCSSPGCAKGLKNYTNSPTFQLQSTGLRTPHVLQFFQHAYQNPPQAKHRLRLPRRIKLFRSPKLSGRCSSWLFSKPRNLSAFHSMFSGPRAFYW